MQSVKLVIKKRQQKKMEPLLFTFNIAIIGTKERY